MIPRNPQTLEEFQEAWPAVVDFIDSFKESPDFLVGDRNIRARPPLSPPLLDEGELDEDTDPCGFGGLVRVDDSTYIKGGAIRAGGDTHQIADLEVSDTPDRSEVVWATVSITANVVDDVLMPGIYSSTVSPSPWGNGTSYPSDTLPTASSPTQDVTVAIGQIVVTNGLIQFYPVGQCAPLQITHCPGSVSYG